VAGLSNKARPSAGDVGFRIGPRLNAAGRMDTARDVVRLFMTDDVEEAEGIARKLDGLNADRQRTEGEVVEAIVERLGKLPPPDVVPVIVVAGEGWHPGVIGIVASRIVERYFRPVLVLSIDPEKGEAVGSGRSIPGFHLLEGLTSLDGIFERYGGHKQAAGCTIRTERIDALRDGLNEYAVSVLGPEDFEPELKLDVELPFESITDETMEQIGRLAPYGLGNPTPLFSTLDVRLDEEPRVLKERHLKLRLSHEDRSFTAMGWRMAELGPTLHSGDSLEAAYAVEADDYWGGWRLNLKDLRKAAD
jgi:single-stranded-DNA-specific exonuclease